MSEPTLLILKPRQLTVAAKKELREAGIIVIEVADPNDVRFMRPNAELSSSELLTVAMRAIHSNTKSGGGSSQELGKALVDAVIAKFGKPAQ